MTDLSLDTLCARCRDRPTSYTQDFTVASNGVSQTPTAMGLRRDSGGDATSRRKPQFKTPSWTYVGA